MIAYKYSNILLKMYLRSLRSEGRLMLGTIPYDAKMLAGVTRHDEGTVEQALEIFKNIGLIEIVDTGAIFMLAWEFFACQKSMGRIV